MNIINSIKKRFFSFFKKQNIYNNRCLNIQEIVKYSPSVILYLSGNKTSAYQGNMWFKVLERLDAKVAIVLREEEINKGLDKTTLPIYLCKTLRDLEYLEINGVKTILYPSHTNKVAQSLRLYRLNHYFINHGESDKIVNQTKLLMAYDKLLVAGPIAKKRIVDAKIPLREGQVEFVGRPQLEFSLNKCDDSIQNKKILNILYAPTWEGFVEEANYSSINQYGLDMIIELMKNENIIIYFKAHPFTGRIKNSNPSQYIHKIRNILENTKHFIIDDEKDIHEYMNISDIMITDISSTIADYLFTMKPMILTNPRSQNQEDINSIYYSSNATYFLEKAEDINLLVLDIKAKDGMLSQRKEISLDILGNIPKGSMLKFNQIINESLKDEE